MKKRIISAIIALLIVVPLIFLGGIYFKLCLTILSVLSIKEVLDIKKDIPKEIKLLSYFMITLMVLLNINIVVKIFIIILTYLLLLIFINNDKYNIELSSYTIFFLIFFVLIYNYIYEIRQDDINILIYLMLVSILTDIFSLFGGKLFGRHKLIEKVSPNKTIEGLLIGTSFGTIIPSIYYLYVVSPGESFIIILLITLTLSLIGSLGDLVFSSIKRYYKIKDFSNIMPGHGGILDRLDSIIFVLLGYIILINFI